jgi:hypothetical protein
LLDPRWRHRKRLVDTLGPLLIPPAVFLTALIKGYISD